MYTVTNLLIKGTLYLLGYLVAIFLGSPLVNGILSTLKSNLKEQEKLPGIKGAGKLIGMIERALTLTFIYLDQPTAIAVVFAAKSIIRFNSTKEQGFAEYYLIGTMTSITFALLTGTLFTIIGKTMI